MNSRCPTICLPVRIHLKQVLHTSLLFVLIIIHLCIFLSFFHLSSRNSAGKLRRVLSWNIHEGRKAKRSQKFRGSKNTHIHAPSLLFYNASSCVLGCFYQIFPLIITPKWRVKSRNRRAAIPKWHFPAVLDGCWYIAVVIVTCNVKQA